MLGMMAQILPLPEIDFAELTTDQLWSIFETMHLHMLCFHK
jgi:hypothetical protein